MTSRRFCPPFASDGLLSGIAVHLVSAQHLNRDITDSHLETREEEEAEGEARAPVQGHG